MKILLQILVSLAIASGLLVSCSSKNLGYDPDTQLDAAEQQQLIWSVIRYIGRAPQGVTASERFYSQYDSFYMEQAVGHRLDAYYRTGDRRYFLISRSAPSLTEKRVATGGWLELDKAGQITDYREVFRTWKMVPDTLTRRAGFLFEKMVKGESLHPWETRNSGGVEYIEFPDERTSFDSASRSWVLKPILTDSLK